MEEWIENFLNSLSSGVLIIDITHRIIWLNDSAEMLIGYLREELIGQPMSLVLATDIAHGERATTLFKGLASFKNRSSVVFQFYTEVVEIIYHNKPHYAFIIEDRLEKERLKETLHKHALMRTAVLSVQADFISSGISRSTQELLYPLLHTVQLVAGCGAVILLGKEDKEILSYSSDQSAFDPIMSKTELLESIEPHLASETVQRVNLDISQYHIRNFDVLPIFRKDVVLAYLVLLNLDESLEETIHEELLPLNQVLTQILVASAQIRENDRTRDELHKSQEALEHQNRELIEAKVIAEKASKAQGAFLANISHEMRTPLNAIMGLCELILTLGIPPKQEKYAKLIYSSSEALLTIINDLLDISKIESGKFKIESLSCDICSIIQEVIRLLAPKAIEKGLRVYFYYSPSLPRRVLTDPTRVRELVMNLLSNAIKFTDNGYILIFCEANEVTMSKMVWSCFIADNGIGIEESFKAHLFQKFSQADSSSKKQYGGTGLGLAICKLLVEKMEGTIGFDSLEGYGSTFYFTLPLKVQKEKFVPIFFDGLKVMIIESDPIQLFIFSQYCKSLKCHVVEAHSDAEALNQLQHARISHTPFDLIILPLLGDLEIVKEAKLHPAKVLFFGWESYVDEYLKDPEEMGGLLLAKPASVVELQEVMVKLFEKSLERG